MQIRGLVLLSTVSLLHLMTSPVQSVYYKNFQSWNSARICKGNYDVSTFCLLADVGDCSCQPVEVELQAVLGSNSPVEYTLGWNGSHCVALGVDDSEAIVFNYSDRSQTCTGGKIVSLSFFDDS